MDSFWNRESVVEVLIWVAIFLLLTVSNFSMDFYLSLSLSAVLVVGMVTLSFFNRKVIIRHFFKRERFISSFFLSLIVLSLMTFLFSYMEDQIFSFFMEKRKLSLEGSLLDISLPEENKPFFEEEALASFWGDSQTTKWKVFILFLGTSLVNCLSFYRRRSIEAESVRKSLLQEKMQMELNFLRSQINPHFLFNAMNNLYSMVYMNDKNAPDAILSLSEMLRYVMNCSKENEISIDKEIVYLENYIDFQRFSYEIPLKVTFSKQVESNVVIAPMLLQPFLENAFKYSGVGWEKDAYILLSLKTELGQIIFYIENTICEKFRAKKEFSNRVGLQNVKKRLKLCYPDRHLLEVVESDNLYKLNLVIDLN